jgi:hypothetical protein
MTPVWYAAAEDGRRGIRDAANDGQRGIRDYDRHTPQQIREGKVAEFIGFQEIRCHFMFDIKMIRFKQKLKDTGYGLD